MTIFVKEEVERKLATVTVIRCTECGTPDFNIGFSEDFIFSKCSKCGAGAKIGSVIRKGSKEDGP